MNLFHRHSTLNVTLTNCPGIRRINTLRHQLDKTNVLSCAILSLPDAADDSEQAEAAKEEDKAESA